MKSGEKHPLNKKSFVLFRWSLSDHAGHEGITNKILQRYSYSPEGAETFIIFRLVSRPSR